MSRHPRSLPMLSTRPENISDPSVTPAPGVGMAPVAPPDRHDPNGDLFDWKLIRAQVRLVRGGPRRHPWLAASCFVLCVGAAILSLWALPRTYRSVVRVQADRAGVVSAISNPGRNIPNDADVPSRAIVDTILREDNLRAIIKETNLVAEWERSRSPAQRLKDRLMARLGKPKTEADKVDGLVAVLEKKFRIDYDQSSITIAIDWPNPQVAYAIVMAAYRNFLEYRHTQAVAMITDAVSILEEHARDARDRVDQAMADIRRLHRESPGGSSGPVSRLSGPRPFVRQSAEVRRAGDLKSAIAATRRAIEDLEESRRRQVATLQAELVQQLATYASAHPTVVSTRQALDALQGDSPQTASLKQREKDLVAEYVRRTGQEPSFEADPIAPLPVEATREIVIQPSPRTGERDDLLDFYRAQLRIHVSKYEELINRIETARIELDSERAAFKYKYSILKPAQPPKRPVGNPLLTLIGGLVTGVFLAFGAAWMIDAWRGRIVEPWQVERELDINVIAAVDSVE